MNRERQQQGVNATTQTDFEGPTEPRLMEERQQQDVIAQSAPEFKVPTEPTAIRQRSRSHPQIEVDPNIPLLKTTESHNNYGTTGGTEAHGGAAPLPSGAAPGPPGDAAPEPLEASTGTQGDNATFSGAEAQIMATGNTLHVPPGSAAPGPPGDATHGPGPSDVQGDTNHPGTSNTQQKKHSCCWYWICIVFFHIIALLIVIGRSAPALFFLMQIVINQTSSSNNDFKDLLTILPTIALNAWLLLKHGDIIHTMKEIMKSAIKEQRKATTTTTHGGHRLHE